MRHRRIEKSNRHKKLKTVQELSDFNFIKDKMLDQVKEQKIPKKLRELFEEKNSKCDDGKKNPKKKKYNTLCVRPSEKFTIEKGMTRAPKPLPEKIEKRFSESDGHFMNRLQRMVAKSIAEANLEEHFDVDLGKRINDAESDPIVVDKEKLEKRKEKNRAKSLKRKEKKLKKQHRLLKQIDKNVEEFDFKKDIVPFGDVVHAPPLLNFKLKT